MGYQKRPPKHLIPIVFSLFVEISKNWFSLSFLVVAKNVPFSFRRRPWHAMDGWMAEDFFFQKWWQNRRPKKSTSAQKRQNIYWPDHFIIFRGFLRNCPWTFCYFLLDLLRLEWRKYKFWIFEEKWPPTFCPLPSWLVMASWLPEPNIDGKARRRSVYRETGVYWEINGCLATLIAPQPDGSSEKRCEKMLLPSTKEKKIEICNQNSHPCRQLN